MAHEELKKLHTSIIDTIKGYDEASKDAETASLASFFEQMGQIHRAHHHAIDAVLDSEGEKLSEDGSFMTAIHKGVIAVRSSITGLRSALPAFADGEKMLIQQYDEAITEASPAAVRTLLTSQKSELQAKVTEMQRLTTTQS